MQPYRIEEMAMSIHANSGLSNFDWDELSDKARYDFRTQAYRGAAALLGGEPVVEVQYGVLKANGKVGFTAPPSAKTYKVAIGNDVLVQREKIVYPAATFVTSWVEPAK